MSIISSLKRLIFGERDEPVKHVPMRALPDPEKTQFSTAVASELKFSDDERASAQQRAETVLKEFNESLNNANLSKNRETREHRLKLAREELIELKELANKFPFLHLQNMQAVEACIIAVEAETRTFPHSEVADISTKSVSDKAQPESLALQGREIESPERSSQDRQRLGASDEQAILMCIQSCFRVVNESIEIARKSKNLETKISRLGVARNSLKQARTQANQFSLRVDGFDAAEAEINRLDEAIKTGTPTEIAGMQQIDVNAAFSSAARNLLKDATALKREKKFIEACEKLREAYSADGAENLMIEDRLRLPMYLQLAGKNDEGWAELNSLSARYVDQFSKPRIAHQMTIFLRKENNETASNPVRVILRDDKNARPLSDNAVQKKPHIFTTIEESQNNKIESWKRNQDIMKGLQFTATMQLRTPLRVLSRHGEIHTDINTEPPEISMEMWEGIWVWKLKTYKEQGITGLPEIPDNGSTASHIGPVLADEYLPFLIAIRKIVELNESIENRINKLREMLSVCEWQEFLDRHGGTEKIVDYFFPKFMNLAAGLDTPNRIAAATDETLLGIKGIGPAKLKTVRDYCAGMTGNRDGDRLDGVLR